MMRFLIVLGTLIALATPAHAGRTHRHHRHIHHVRPIGAPVAHGFWSSLGGDVVNVARSQIGNGAIYGRRNLWCARFMNYVLERTGYRGTGSDMAQSFAAMPRTTMHVGAIAVMGRRGGGHVGVVSGIDQNGNPIVISGNHGHRVAEAVYPRSRVYAFVVPQ